MSSHNKNLSLVWTEKNGLQRMPESSDFDAYRKEGAIIVPEHHAKLAGRMLEALERCSAFISVMTEVREADMELDSFLEEAGLGEAQCGLAALIARAKGGSDE